MQENTITKEYETLAKLNLEVILKYGEKLSDEKIKEILNSDNWKERVNFSVNEDGIGWKGVHWYRMKPIRYVKWRDEKIKEQEKELSSNGKLIEEQTLKIEELSHYKERAEVAERDNEIHLEALETAGKERWTQKEKWQNEAKEKDQKLEDFSKLNDKKNLQINELQREKQQLKLEVQQLMTKLEATAKEVEKGDLEKKELKSQLKLFTKNLPSLPKKQNKSQQLQLKTKIKTKLQQFKQLVTKKKVQEKELICRVEVGSK